MSESALFSTGLVRYGQETDYRCYLCADGSIVRSQDLHEHIENDQHVSAIRRFHLIFCTNSDSIDCKACNANIDWKGFRNHAEWHRIVPWYEIEDKDKKFFENRVLNVHSSFICVPCEKRFDDWTGAFVHVGQEHHRELIDLEPPIHETFAPTDSSYGFLISEGFEPWGSNTVKCRPCLSPNVRLNNLQEHVAQPEHVAAKLRFIADTKYLVDSNGGRKNGKNFVTDSNRNHNASGSINKSDTTSAIEKLVVGLRAGAFSDRDKISNLPNQHRSDSNSRMSNSGSHRRDWNRRNRTVCRSNSTSGSHNKDSNRQGNHSQRSNSSLRQNSSLDPPHSKSQSKNFTPRNGTANSGNGHTAQRGQKHDWPVETRGDGRWCTICNEVVQSTSDVHVAEERHTSNLKRLGREYVVAKGSHEFWCNCCKVKVPNLENVFRHIKGGRHRLNIPAARDERNEAAEFKGAAKVKAQEEAKNERKREEKAENKVEKEKGKVTSFKIDFSEASHPPAMNLPSLMQPIPFHQPLLGGLAGGIIPPHGRSIIRPVGPIPVQPMVYGPLNNHQPQPLMQFPMAMNNPAQPYLPLVMNNSPFPAMDSKFTPERLPRDYIIIQNANDLVCRICDVIIRGHGNVDEHIKHESHRRTVEDFCATIVPRGENNYYCNRCNASFTNRNDLYIHLCQFSHRGNQALVTNSQHASAREGLLGSSNLNVQKKSLIAPPTVFSGEHVSNDFIVILGRFDFCCKLCHVLLQDHALIDIHLQESEHRNAFHTYERTKIIKDNTYTCKSCKCVIPNFANVPPHAFGDQHRLKSPGSSTSIRSGSRELGPNFIVKIGEEDYYCVICNVTIITTSHLEQHLKDDMHFGAREKYGCEQIIATNGGNKNLRCKCCNCSIPEFDCVYVHLSGQRHMQNVASRRQEQLRQKDNEANVGKDEASGEKEEAPKPVEKIADVEIKRQSEVVSPEARESIVEVSSKKDEPRSASEQARIDAEKFVRMMEDEMNADLTHSLKIEEQMKRFAVDEDSMTSRSLASSTMSLNTSGKKLRAPRVKKPEIAAPVEIDIFEMREKLRELENDMRLCAHSDDPLGDRVLYFCMVCLERIGEKTDLYKHFRSHDHCDALVSKKMAHKEFELIADQFSDWDLAQEFLEEKSEDIIHCWACKDDMKNLDEVIRAHMANEIHIEKRDSIREKNQSTFAKDIEPNIRCDWYDIQEFHCTLCNATYDSEFRLAEHTRSAVHVHTVNEIDSTLRPLIYDFCATCSILWYCERTQFAYHVVTRRHESRLAEKSKPETQKLRNNLADLIFDICRNGIEEMSADPYQPRRQFIADLEATVQQNFPGSKARVIAANPLSTDSGKFEVFLDFGVTLDGRSEDSVRFLAQRVASALSDHPAKWYMALTNDKNMPIKVTTHHLPSKSRVEIFLDDKLVLTPSKLFNSLRGASVYLDWPIRTVKFCMTLYENEFHEFMRPYIEDTMVFFLQSKSLFPKISDLVRYEDRPFFKPDWDLEVNGLETLKKYSVKPWDLIKEYHRFYATFDYRCEVACPWIGKAVKKRDSAKLKNLSKGINSTCDLTNGGFVTSFCVQNPFGLMENRTGEMSKAQLNGFREYCSRIVEILEHQGTSNSD